MVNLIPEVNKAKRTNKESNLKRKFWGKFKRLIMMTFPLKNRLVIRLRNYLCHIPRCINFIDTSKYKPLQIY